MWSVHGVDALLGLLLCLTNTKIYCLCCIHFRLNVSFHVSDVPVNVKANSLGNF